MYRRSLFFLVAASCWLAASGSAGLPASSAQTRPAGAASAPTGPEFRAFLNQYCTTCHNEQAKTAGLMLDKLDVTNVGPNAEAWEKVIVKLRAGMMPPSGSRRPDQAAYDRSVAWLESALDAENLTHPNPGTTGLHRLNRTEYANAIRDLLTLDIDVAPLLPPDDPLYGFDNIAEALGVTPILMERYLAAADKVSALAVGDPDSGTTSWFYRVRQDLSQDRHVEGLPLGTVGGIATRVTLPLDGEYVIQPKLFRTNLGVMRGLETPHQLEITVDGERVHIATFGGFDDFKNQLENQTKVGDDTDTKLRVRVPIKAGPHKVTVAFLQKSAAAGTLRLQPFIRSSADTIDITGHPHLDTVLITGPLNPTGPGDTPSRRKIFTCRPASARPQDETTCATNIISAVARRAYRRPVSSAEMQILMSFYQIGRGQGTFERGIQVALYRILSSPNFVFRAEPAPNNVAAGASYRISDFELASRLSFFLWSSIPDDELLNLAAQNRLRTPAVLAQQVQRMIADPRFVLVENFGGQWLYLRNLKGQVPDSNIFPDFDDNLRQAFKDETEMFFKSIIQEDRSVLDLLTADYTFVNERLARHYGISNIYGSQMRRVKVPSDARRGLLGKGAILMVTSHVDRTSPVVRGKWILENLLGAPPPMPPANVPPLEDADDARPRTMRERMELHRENPACSSCHKMMDPVGFSLENFDAVGAWRDKDGTSVIDASGQLVDGRQVDGVVALRNSIVERPELFLQTVTAKLMTYGLGRGLQSYDMPVVRGIVRDASRANYKFSSILNGIINSAAFQMRVKPRAESNRPTPNTAAAVR